MHYAGAGHGDAGAGAAGQIAVGLRRVGGGLLVAHADIGNPFLLRGCGDRGDRKPDDPEQVIDALLFEAPGYQGRAVDFAHAFLLVFQARDYALMARPRKGFAGSTTARRPPRCARTDPPSPCARARAKRFDEIASPHCRPQPRDPAIFGFQPGCQKRKLRYRVYATTRKSSGEMIRKLSVIRSRKRSHFLGTVRLRKRRIADLNWAKVS